MARRLLSTEDVSDHPITRLLDDNAAFRNKHEGQPAYILGRGTRPASVPPGVTFAVNDFHRDAGIVARGVDYCVVTEPLFCEHPVAALMPTLEALRTWTRPLTAFFPIKHEAIVRRAALSIAVERRFYAARDSARMLPSFAAPTDIDATEEIPSDDHNPLKMAVMMALFMGCDPIVMVGHDAIARSERWLDEGLEANLIADPALRGDVTWQRYRIAIERIDVGYAALRAFARARGRTIVEVGPARQTPFATVDPATLPSIQPTAETSATREAPEPVVEAAPASGPISAPPTSRPPMTSSALLERLAAFVKPSMPAASGPAPLRSEPDPHTGTAGPFFDPDKEPPSETALLERLEGLPICDEIRALHVIGAHLFQEGPLLLKLFPRLGELALFEPQPKHYAMLADKAAGSAGVHVLPYAIADFDGPATFNITNNEASSSLLDFGTHRELFPHVDTVEQIEVACRTLDSVITTEGLHAPDCLFIDVQGAEHKVLSAISDAVLEGVRLIYTEASLDEVYQGAKPLADIRRLLEPRFTFMGFCPLARHCPTHGNALFIRTADLAHVGLDPDVRHGATSVRARVA